MFHQQYQSDFIENTVKVPIKIVNDYFEKLNSVAFQGGYGHRVYWDGSWRKIFKKDGYEFCPGLCPDHWVVPVECYEELKPDNLIRLFFKMIGFHFELSEIPQQEHWGN
jgi:hypothetical protein